MNPDIFKLLVRIPLPKEIFGAVNCNPGHNMLRLFDVLTEIFSSQVEGSAIIGNKHSIYELPNDLILRILRYKEISGTSLNFIEL